MLEGGAGEPAELCLAERPEAVRALAARCARAEAIAVDVEADGLFAFRPKLCTLQLAFREGGGFVVGVVDTLKADVAPLVEVLSERGPVKVLHDLTFDARLLEESGAPLARVRDTSVAARLLGYKVGGLAALLRLELGLDLDKKYQQHDWSRRPLLPEQIRYLADDVLHLLPLDERLAEKAAALGIEDEIAEECAYKLASAQRPPRDPRPSYVRIKGAPALDPVGRAVLRRLCDARDAAAEEADVPPFKMASNELLLDIAAKRPTNAGALRALMSPRSTAAHGSQGPPTERHRRLSTALLAAVLEGVRDGDVPEDHRAFFEPVRMDRAVVARRRGIESRITGWRRAEAKRRGVDEQAVLPGHCVQDLVSVLSAFDPIDPASPDIHAAVARVPGFGARRMERYGRALIDLAAAPLDAQTALAFAHPGRSDPAP